MTITLSSQLEAQVRDRAKAEGISIEQYIERLIQDDEWSERSDLVSEPDSQHAEIRAAVTEGLQQAARGEGKPAAEVFRNLRAKHGLSG